MNGGRLSCRALAALVVGAWSLGAGSGAQAHSASDAYLSLTLDRSAVSRAVELHGQWDIALRDLDFVLALDDDGNGQVTWGELKHHLPAIQRYAYSHLVFEGGRHERCAIKPTRIEVDGHADGTYAALFFDVVCLSSSKTVTVDYAAFFAVDPSHRGILTAQSRDAVSTAVLSPDRHRMDLPW